MCNEHITADVDANVLKLEIEKLVVLLLPSGRKVTSVGETVTLQTDTEGDVKLVLLI